MTALEADLAEVAKGKAEVEQTLEKAAADGGNAVTVPFTPGRTDAKVTTVRAGSWGP